MFGIAVSMFVAGDEGVGEEELTPFYRDEASLEACVTRFHRFDFGSGQYQACLVVIPESIVEMSSFVGGDGGHRYESSMKYRV